MSYGSAWSRALFLAAATVCAALPMGSATADDLVVQYDQARLLRLPEPASSILVGNPSIAEVSMHSSTLLVVTGKTFGVTNLIVLDDTGRVIMSERLMVKADDQKVVSVQKGTASQTYNCVPKCEPVLKIGDDDNYYQSISKASESKMKISEGADSGQAAN